MKYSNSYIVCIQFLGFRFHGWQKQKGLKTIHGMIDKTLSFVFAHTDFKTIGVGRTDAKVSAVNYPFQLFISQDIDFENFKNEMNQNLPPDISFIEIKSCSTNFAIINAPKLKTYQYYFTNQKSVNPYSSPFIVNFKPNLDISLMKIAAKKFEGTHFFHKYCANASNSKIYKRTIEGCQIFSNNQLFANFIHPDSYILEVKGTGFLQYQIRFMMAILVEIGKGNYTIDQLKESISENNDKIPMKNIAPSSGLHLFNIQFL